MRRKKNSSLFILLSLVLVFSLGVLFLDYMLLGNLALPSFDYTGKVTGVGTSTVTQAGAAGITVTDVGIAFGSGYYNATCTGNTFATLDSNLTYGDGSGTSVYGQAAPYCWVNTTAILGGTGRDNHTLQNNGSVMVNVSAIADKHAEDWLCGGNCPFTDFAKVALLSYNGESGSCAAASNLTVGYENSTTNSLNITVGICDRLDYVDTSDSIIIFVNVSIPKDATAGAKTLTITYEALGL
ncbi:MAG: hypothetical protein Q8R18_01790 [bacterium]|nr:hypothetical protein [bacterium]